jgi:Domain of unknown function (DUF4269)
MKTEPAFAAVLGLRGDPYVALLDLGEQGDQTLISVLRAQGFAKASHSITNRRRLAKTRAGFTGRCQTSGRCALRAAGMYR